MRDWEALEPDYRLPIGNFEPSSISKKRGVVIHHNAGVGMTHEQVKSAFLSNGTSAQYNVDGAGSVCQYVNDRDRAWHCSGKKTGTDCNTLYIGIEHADKSSDPWLIADAALEEGAHLVAALCLKYGWGRPEWRKNVFPHSDFSYTACPGELAASQRDAYMARAQYWYDAMKDGDDMTPEQSKMLQECHHQLTRTDDPTGRGACQDFYVHEKFLAGLAQDVNKKVEDIQGKVDEINATLAKLEKKLG